MGLKFDLNQSGKLTFEIQIQNLHFLKLAVYLIHISDSDPCIIISIDRAVRVAFLPVKNVFLLGQWQKLVKSWHKGDFRQKLEKKVYFRILVKIVLLYHRHLIQPPKMKLFKKY